MNNPTINDHNNERKGNRGVEVFLYLFIFGGMFLVLIAVAVGLNYFLKQNPKLITDIKKSLEESNKPKKQSYNYNNNRDTYDTDRVVTNDSTTVNIYRNMGGTTNQEGTGDMDNQVPDNNNTYTQPVPTRPYTPPTPACYTYEIYSGELKSKRCYTDADYKLISDYYSKYQSADWSYDAANSSIKFLCDGSDFFKDSCNDAKERKNKAADNKEKYLELGLAIIARGTPVN